ncbi:NUDIX domain-containing protein [Sandarakinorhabdus limnophila]|uniref:NUDIX domain-containing protein n=1 Tax=Sandarakinorhabdus limnophila TaxID=210512 RepID=UPI0003B4CAA3|nr:NUDIX hydrolase [Sandarakinorhabdus limnophila]
MITPWDGADFAGAKLAALVDGHILTYRRDNKPGIPWPGLIDLPGGGREGDESPALCALRELHEEFGLHLPEQRIWWARPFPAMDARSGSLGRTGWFLAATITRSEVNAIRFDTEGHSPQLLGLDAFLAASDAIAPLQQRLRLVLETPRNGAVL